MVILKTLTIFSRNYIFKPMKKTTLLKANFILIISVVCYTSLLSQHDAPVRTMDIPAVVGVPPHLDGIDDDVCWSTESAVTEVYYQAGWTGAADLSGYIKFCWDNYYLYVFANIVDDIAQIYPNTGDVYQYDNFLVCLDADTANPGLYGDDALNFRFNRGVLYTQTGYGPRNEAVLDYFQVNGTGSWQMEIAIPWLAFLPENTDTADVWNILDINAVGFDAIFADADGSLRDAMSAWDADVEGSGTTEDNAFENTRAFGTLRLIGTPFTNYRPIAVAGADQTTNENTTVTLSGVGSYDPEAEPITYHWSTTSGLTITNSDSSVTDIIIPEVDVNTNYIISLVVNDGIYNSYADRVTIAVNNINKPPVANAGPNQITNELSMVALNGSASSDPDPQPLFYNWTSLQGGSLINSNQANPFFFAPEVAANQNYQFVLTVNDGDLFSAADTVSVSVLNVSNTSDTLYIYDSVFVYDTVFVFDSVFSFTTQYDSVFVFDSIVVSDTLFSTQTIYDTLIVYDSVYSFQTVYDTLIVYDSVFSTQTIYDTIVVRDSLFVYDTIFSTDTIKYYNTILITVVDEVNRVVVTEVSGDLHVKLYPNPADVFLKIDSEFDLENIEIVNSVGTIVFSESVSDDAIQIDISGFAAGIYIVKLSGNYGSVSKTLVVE